MKVLTRGKSKSIDSIKYVQLGCKTLSGWENELENASVLINLAGKSVDYRYTAITKKEIYNSKLTAQEF
jgi:NAD dependent epimerase/dehydratase family enzyme